jgi:protocatechuate 3,4-dioxygenase alpha subunit
MGPGQTPSQTVGPYFSLRLGAEGENMITGSGVRGKRIRVAGKVLDGDRQPIEDALLEVWQADAAGRYRHPDDSREEIPLDPGFTGFGRALTDFDTGEYVIETVKPGGVPDPEGTLQAPHLNLIIQARGMLNPSFTRVYFSDEEEANRTDLILGMVDPERRDTLIAECEDPGDPTTYRFDVRFQGEDETVFFEF